MNTHKNNETLFTDKIRLTRDSNPTKDYYKPIEDFQLDDAAVSWETLYKTTDMSKFDQKGELADTARKRELIATIERLSDFIKNNGLDPKTGMFETMDNWYGKIEELSKIVAKDYGTGAASVVVRQVFTRTLEKLDTEESIHQIFTKKMNVKTNEEIILPVIGSVASASLDLGPNTEPHILSVSNDATMVAKCGRSGIAVVLQHEAMKLSKYNLLNLYLTEAKNSLIRWKDIKAIRLAFNKGKVLFDNLDPTSSILGKTTGMSFKTQKYNGSFTLRDFYNMFLCGVQNNTVCDTVLVSTIGWLIFMSDPIIQRFVEHNGGVIFRGPTGKFGKNLDPYRAMISGTRPEESRLMPQIPSGLMNVAFRFVVTPFVPFYTEGQIVYRDSALGNIKPTPYLDKESKPVKCGKDPLTNLIMLDSSKAILYLEEEGVKTAEEKDNLREKTEIRLIERYAFDAMYDGAGILVAKNISVTDDTLDVRTFVNISYTEAKNAIAGAEQSAIE